METHQAVCFTSGTLSFILWLSCIAGIAPLKFEGVRDGWRIRVSRLANVYGQILVVLFCVLAIASEGMSSVLSRTLIDRLVSVFTVMLVVLVALVATFTGMNRMQHLIDSVMRINKINVELNSYQSEIETKQWKSWVLVLCLLLLGNVTIFTDYGIFMYENATDNGLVTSISLNIFYYLIIAYVQLISLQFCLVCLHVLSSYKLLNNCLKILFWTVNGDTSDNEFDKNSYSLKLNTSKNNTGMAKILPKPIPARVQRLGTLYCSLCDVMRTVNKSYDILLIQLLLAFLLLLVVSPYQLITKFNILSPNDLYRSILQLFWVVFHVSNLLVVVEPCHQTHEEINVTKDLISKLMNYAPESDQALNTELLMFYRYLKLNDVEYSPLGMFTMSRSLIMTILGSLATYLLLLITIK